MSRKKNKNIGIDLGDLPSNYVLKIEDDFIANKKEEIDILPDEFSDENNITNKIDVYNNKKN
ncbi:hypothetical protein RBU49_01375 [Clostridium sp. MB40-C1]|uniref:hypothetical protein n=1 Tax=Clostridium sp. MB40-C1 TaxID=3070996 RepID=UPI0027E06E83|nr:hypothetical protein [Clostridium sp. MB40-C1]WMJ80928.1 hypothetical protein RBU49_01375 [Clostridium sp. MB40-C1]